MKNKEQVVEEVWDVLQLWNPFDNWYSLREIADELGITEKKVRVQLKKFQNAFPEQYKDLKNKRDQRKKNKDIDFDHPVVQGENGRPRFIGPNPRHAWRCGSAIDMAEMEEKGEICGESFVIKEKF